MAVTSALCTQCTLVTDHSIVERKIGGSVYMRAVCLACGYLLEFERIYGTDQDGNQVEVNRLVHYGWQNLEYLGSI